MSAPAKYLALAGSRRAARLDERTALVGRSLFLGAILFIFSRVWQVIGVRAALPGVGPGELVWYLALSEWAVLSVPMLFLATRPTCAPGTSPAGCAARRIVGSAQIAEALGETAVRLAVSGPSAFLFAYLLAGGLPADPRGRGSRRRWESWRASCGCWRGPGDRAVGVLDRRHQPDGTGSGRSSASCSAACCLRA